jgi:hypothetical protein
LISTPYFGVQGFQSGLSRRRTDGYLEMTTEPDWDGWSEPRYTGCQEAGA